MPQPCACWRLGHLSGFKRASKLPKQCAGCRLVYVTLKYHARCHFRESSCRNDMPVDVSEPSRGPFWRRPGGSGSQKCRRCDENTTKLVKSDELSAILTFRRQIGWPGLGWPGLGWSGLAWLAGAFLGGPDLAPKGQNRRQFITFDSFWSVFAPPTALLASYPPPRTPNGVAAVL